MVSTRSQSKTTSPTNASNLTSSKPKPAPRPAKRRAPAALKSEPRAKKAKTTEHPDEITINRAPVLKLWSACVTHFLHPSLPWSTCLSAGSAISSICAISKGKSIGAIETHSDNEDGKKKDSKRKDSEVFEVMKFKLKVRDGVVSVGNKKESGAEEPLKAKFGEKYGDVKRVFEEVLWTWKGDEEELGQRGFEFYEEFRPSVPKGQKGWGRKGTLDLDKVKSVASN